MLKNEHVFFNTTCFIAGAPTDHFLKKLQGLESSKSPQTIEEDFLKGVKNREKSFFDLIMRLVALGYARHFLPRRGGFL